VIPYQQVSGVILDSGNYPGAMRKLLDLIDYESFPRIQAEALREGRRIGIGLGQELVAEGCSLPTSLLVAGYDGSTVRINPSGQVTVLTGVTSPILEGSLGVLRLVGLFTRSAAVATSLLLLSFAAAMTISLGIKRVLGYSVLSALCGALFLAAEDRYPLSMDALLTFEFGDHHHGSNSNNERDSQPPSRWSGNSRL
jgi:uncharacterized membrane protein YphA (DoxX/SURF4 family)